MDGPVMTWVLDLVGSPWTYVAVATTLALGALLTFLPSQSLVVALATLAAGSDSSYLSLGWLLLSAGAGMVVGDAALFAMARRFDFARISWLGGDRITHLRGWTHSQLELRPRQIMVTGRLIPLGRIATTLASADAGVAPARFVAWAALGAGVWSAYSVLIGAAAGAWAEQHPVLTVVIAVGVSMLLGTIFQVVQRRFATAAASR